MQEVLDTTEAQANAEQAENDPVTKDAKSVMDHNNQHSSQNLIYLNTKYSIQNSDKNEEETNPICCSAGSNLYNSDAEDGPRLSADGHHGDRDQVDNEEVFPRIDNESFIQRLLLEGDQPESIGSAPFQ